MLRDFDDVSTHDLQRLLERVNAHEEPITRTQLDAFIEHPWGPILPPQCVMARRVPAELMGNAHLITSAAGADDIILDPETNEPILLGSRGDMHVIVRGDRVSEVVRADRVLNGRILGRARSGEAVTGFWTRFSSSLDSGLEEFHLFIGNQEQPRRILGAGVLSDGSVVQMVDPGSPVGNRERGIYRDDKLVEKWSFAQMEEFFLEGADVSFSGREHLWFMVLDEQASQENRRWLCTYVGRGSFIGEGGGFRHVDALISTPRGMRFLLPEGGIYSWDEANDRLIRDELGRSLPTRYREHYRELDETTFAYVGEPKRDKEHFVCWVVARGDRKGQFVRQPSFQRVTDLFTREGALCYWGLLGGFLYLMELPASLEVEQ